jgi:lipid-A-disaccharide synthase-like uncharacterized protein
MDKIDLLGSIATVIGLIRLLMYYYKIYKSSDDKLPDLNYVILGIITSSMLLYYTIHKGSKLSVISISTFLILESFVLLRLLKKKIYKSK